MDRREVEMLKDRLRGAAREARARMDTFTARRADNNLRESVVPLAYLVVAAVKGMEPDLLADSLKLLKSAVEDHLQEFPKDCLCGECGEDHDSPHS